MAVTLRMRVNIIFPLHPVLLNAPPMRETAASMDEWILVGEKGRLLFEMFLQG